MKISEMSPLGLLVENKIDVVAELENIESETDGAFLLNFYNQFPTISKVFYACGLKSCLEEYQDKVDGYKEDSIVLFKHESSRNVIDSLYERVNLVSCLDPQMTELNGYELFHYSSCRSYLYELFCFGYFKANLILEGSTKEAFETYRKCCVYVYTYLCKESDNKLNSKKEMKLSEELNRIDKVVSVFKTYNIEIPSLLLEKTRIIKRIIKDSKTDPICKSFSQDDILNILGIEKPNIQDEIDEL